MDAPETKFGSAWVEGLRARTEYETWLLEAVYEIVAQRLAADRPDEFIYTPNGGAPTLTAYLSMHLCTGDWRPGFLKAGAPLVFVTGFKLLDMLLEGVLEENGHRSTYRYAKKTEALKGSIRFPPIVETRPWLRTRLVALYEALEPLRGTIIHNRYFSTSNGDLQVSSTKGGTVGEAVTISATDLRNLAHVLVSVERCIEGTWTMDPLLEKRIRRDFDELAHLHGLEPLGQLPPELLRVRIYVGEDDSTSWDIDRFRKDVAARRPGRDLIFDLHAISVSRDGTSLGSISHTLGSPSNRAFRIEQDTSRTQSIRRDTPG